MCPRSFMSEHTAEYVLVNDVVRRLAPAFSDAIPIFFWSTREGNLTARESMSALNVKILTCFARRPKLHATDDRILMKVNRQLFSYCRASSAVGIPVVAGIPLVRSLHLLRMTSPCCWFDIAKLSSSDDLSIEVMLDGLAASMPSSNETTQFPLANEDIQTLVTRSPNFTWESAIGLIRDIRRAARLFDQASGYRYFPWFGGYKPFHIILPTANHEWKLSIIGQSRQEPPSSR
jgi:hypothetical protein